jgi:hypothetical protein
MSLTLDLQQYISKTPIANVLLCVPPSFQPCLAKASDKVRDVFDKQDVVIAKLHIDLEMLYQISIHGEDLRV